MKEYQRKRETGIIKAKIKGEIGNKMREGVKEGGGEDDWPREYRRVWEREHEWKKRSESGNGGKFKWKKRKNWKLKRKEGWKN